MLNEGQYNIVSIYSATKGMNQEIAPHLMSQDYSYYIENVMPQSLGEWSVRFGNVLFSEAPQDTIIKSFAFEAPNGTEQQVLYMNGYNAITPDTFSNLAIVSAYQIRLTHSDYALFQPDTFLRIQFDSPSGTSNFSYCEIKKVTLLDVNTIEIEVSDNTFPDSLWNPDKNQFFYATPFWVPDPVYISPTQFSITIPDGFGTLLYFSDGQVLQLTVDSVVTLLTIAPDGIDDSVPGTITFTCTGTSVPDFSGAGSVVLKYQSSLPSVHAIANSFGYIKVLDVATNALLTGGDQTISNLSVACVPRAEFFGEWLWIYNGVDPIMTWDGSILKVYKEFVKEQASAFGWTDATHFTFTPSSAFIIGKYQNNNTIKLNVLDANNKQLSTVTTTVVDVSINPDPDVNIVTIETADEIPDFAGGNRIQLYYIDQPPTFSFMKGAHDRLWCLGTGAVGLDYRVPEEALKVYYPYFPYSDTTEFRFFHETLKIVPFEDISAKHGVADNLEAIISVSGYLAFIGRQRTQIWQGIDPITKSEANSFSWTATLPAGIYHGDLIVELANDAYFVNQNGFMSASTFNVARQFGMTSTNNMDKLALEYINSIDTNIAYRACRSFKYENGGFCGFKIGQNNIIVSRYHTSLYWWGVFSGDFAKASCFLSNVTNPLYLCIGSNIYAYADGTNGDTCYGDNDGNDLITAIETKYINNIKNRFANKRYEVQCNYSSNVVVDKANSVNIYVRGDLRTPFTLSDLYKFRLRGDNLGTINLLNGDGIDPNNPPKTSEGFRLESPSQTIKGRLKFISSVFSVTLVAQIKDGPFSLNKIRLFGLLER